MLLNSCDQVSLKCMIRFLLLLFANLFSWFPFVASQELQPIGTWADHLSYNAAISISGNPSTVSASTNSAVILIDRNENSVWRKSKVSGLSSADITGLTMNPENGDIIILYSTGNIDILSGERVYNIDDIPKSNLNPAPVLHSLNVYGPVAYIASSYGISVLDLSKKEIRETYFIGKDGSMIDVLGIAVFNDRLFAATSEGLKSASLSSPNLQDYRNWRIETGQNGLFPGPVQHIVSTPLDLIISKDDTLLSFTGSEWKEIYNSPGRITSIGAQQDELIVTEKGETAGMVIIIGYDGSIIHSIEHNVYTAYPMQAIKIEQEYWIADSLSGVSMFNGNSFTSYTPSSPAGVATGEMIYANKQIIVSGGTVKDLNQASNKDAGVYIFKERNWTNYTKQSHPELQNINDLVAIAYDKINDQLWAGSFGDGLIRFNPDATIIQYKEGSFIEPSAFMRDEYNVSALEFDDQNNLWISNYGADQSIVVQKPGGDIEKFRPPFALNQNAVGDILIDDSRQVWIISPNGNGLLIFHYGNDLENKNDDQWRLFKQGAGAGNLPTNEVLSIAKDHNGFIWIGTSSGIGIIQCPEQVFTSQGCEALLPVIQQGNFAGYLFKGEAVQAIAVDGANRKWIGTRNGVWLISEDGEKTIERFNASNSFLVDNDVRKITIDKNTGEVYFATSKGICSYRGSATGIEETRTSVIAYPNPVPPGYEGTIAIRGLPANSIVKITELDGRLVYQTRAQGEQAIWNGKNYKGQRVNTGIYLVFARSSSGTETIVTKIAFINK